MYNYIITIDYDQPLSVEFSTCRNALTQKRKVYKHKAKLSVSDAIICGPSCKSLN